MLHCLLSLAVTIEKFKIIHICDSCWKLVLSLWKLTYNVFSLFILRSNFQSWHSQFLFWEVSLHYFFEVFCFLPLYVHISECLLFCYWAVCTDFSELPFLYCFPLSFYSFVCCLSKFYISTLLLSFNFFHHSKINLNKTKQNKKKQKKNKNKSNRTSVL